MKANTYVQYVEISHRGDVPEVFGGSVGGSGGDSGRLCGR